MDIRNIGEFVQYCQERHEDEDLPKTLELAEHWTDASTLLERQYGGHGQEKPEWIESAYQHMVDDGLEITHDQLLQTHEILTRFWEHGEAFDQWFKSKVIIIKSN